MSIQDNTEKVLRKLHLLFAEAQEYPDNNRYIIVEKWQAQKLLNDLNNCMNNLLEEYELTKESRDAFERASRKQGDQIIEESKRRADDVYAASVLYSNEALTELWKIIHDSAEAMEQVYSDMDRKLQAQERTVRKNQSELKAHLRNMEDTEKYMRLMNDENRRIEAERRERSRVIRQETSVYADREPEVKVDKNILAKLGLQPVMDVESLDDFDEETVTAVNEQQPENESSPAADASGYTPKEAENIGETDAIRNIEETEEINPDGKSNFGKVSEGSEFDLRDGSEEKAENRELDIRDDSDEKAEDREIDLRKDSDEKAEDRESGLDDNSVKNSEDEEIDLVYDSAVFSDISSEDNDQMILQIGRAILDAADEEMPENAPADVVADNTASEEAMEEDSAKESSNKISLTDILGESRENLIDNTDPDDEHNPDNDLITIDLKRDEIKEEKKDKASGRKNKKSGFPFRRK